MAAQAGSLCHSSCPLDDTRKWWHRLLACARPLLTLAVASLITATPADRALAHAFEPALLLLSEQAPDVFAVTWRAPSGVVDAAPNGHALAPRLASHCRPMDADEPVPMEPRVEPTLHALVDCRPQGLRGTTISVEGIETSPADVIVQIKWLDGTSTGGILHRGDPVFALPESARAAGESAGKVSQRYVVLGTQHILLGIDHLMFVLGLLLLVTDLRMLLKTITAFTVAHSVTLALAVLGVLQVPPPAVEACIALSIVLLAVEVARAETGYALQPTLARQFPWVVAFVFGLLHGLGFAGALTQIGLPAGQIAVSLVAFNLGVEAGQLAFVAVLLVLAETWRRLGFNWRRARLVPTYTMGAVAVAWTLERLGWLWSALAS